MTLSLKESAFSRNRSREREGNSFFNTIHRSLTSFGGVFFTIILASTFVVTSFLSHASFLMIANIFLALGCLAHFCNRVYRGEVFFSEAVITVLSITMLFLLAFYFLPVIPGFSAVGALFFINLISTVISSFYLNRDLIVPPLQSIMQNIFKFFGYEMKASSNFTMPLTLENDREVIDSLLRKFKNYDSFDKSNFTEDDIVPFNKTLKVLSRYIDKYKKTFLGYFINYDQIKKLEGAVRKYSQEGNAEGGSTTFIKLKLGRKRTKINRILEVKEAINCSTKDSDFNWEYVGSFFNGLDSNADVSQTRAACIRLLDTEVERQQGKFNELSTCGITISK
jgi:hypothetical protein